MKNKGRGFKWKVRDDDVRCGSRAGYKMEGQDWVHTNNPNFYKRLYRAFCYFEKSNHNDYGYRKGNSNFESKCSRILKFKEGLVTICKKGFYKLGIFVVDFGSSNFNKIGLKGLGWFFFDLQIWYKGFQYIDGDMILKSGILEKTFFRLFKYIKLYIGYNEVYRCNGIMQFLGNLINICHKKGFFSQKISTQFFIEELERMHGLFYYYQLDSKNYGSKRSNFGINKLRLLYELADRIDGDKKLYKKVILVITKGGFFMIEEKHVINIRKIFGDGSLKRKMILWEKDMKFGTERFVQKKFTNRKGFIGVDLDLVRRKIASYERYVMSLGQSNRKVGKIRRRGAEFDGVSYSKRIDKKYKSSRLFAVDGINTEDSNQDPPGTGFRGPDDGCFSVSLIAVPNDFNVDEFNEGIDKLYVTCKKIFKKLFVKKLLVKIFLFLKSLFLKILIFLVIFFIICFLIFIICFLIYYIFGLNFVLSLRIECI